MDIPGERRPGIFSLFVIHAIALWLISSLFVIHAIALWLIFSLFVIHAIALWLIFRLFVINAIALWLIYFPSYHVDRALTDLLKGFSMS